MPCRPAICSHSLGRAWVHDLPEKLDEAAKYGLSIELFYEDLEYVAKSLPGGSVPCNLQAAARIIRSMSDERGITIMCLQPFMHYEGLRDRQRHAQRIEEIRLWFDLAKILGTDLISIPSSFLSKEEVSGDMNLIVADLQEVADLGASADIQCAYESLAWGTYSDTWEQSWEIVERVDRPNFGICLDTFNMAARMYADPKSQDRRNPNAAAATQASIERLVRTVDVRKIAYVQVVDAEYLAEPLVEGHEYYNAAQPSRMSWSRNCRLFYGEEDRGAYLPIKAILRAILVDLGYEGWISAEMFNRSLTDPDTSVPAEHGRRAADSWQKIVRDFNLEGQQQDAQAAPIVFEQAPRAQL